MDDCGWQPSLALAYGASESNHPAASNLDDGLPFGRDLADYVRLKVLTIREPGFRF